MSDRIIGIKTSDFLSSGTTAINGSAEIPYVFNNTNLTVTFTDFLAQLGTTGSLQQEGALTGVPVLDDQGTIKGIRNLEQGFGITLGVSPENGITISTGFSFDNKGVLLVNNIVSPEPVFASIGAGAGVGVTKVDDEIIISVVDSPVSTKTVVVSSLSDLPNAVSGRIQLADETQYLQVNDVDVGVNVFDMGTNSVYTSSSSEVINLTCTLGSGTLFTAVDSVCSINNIEITATGMDFVNFSSTSGFDTLLVSNLTLLGFNSLGEIDNAYAVRWNETFIDSLNDGLLFKGNLFGFTCDGNLCANLAAGTMFDLGAATFSSGTIKNCLISHQAGSYFMSGLAGSGNINANAIFTVLNNRVVGGLGIQNITTNDAQFQFALNDTLADTRSDSMVYLSGNTTATVISAPLTPAQVAGTFVVEREGQFTATAGGVCTYDGVRPAVLPIDATFSAILAGGGDKQISGYIAINGVAIAGSSATTTVSSTKTGSGSCLWQASINPGDEISLWVSNEDNTENIIVQSCVLRVN